MIENNNNNDDRCQNPDKCSKSLFTYCPHCQLFLCITHLNEHHNLMKKDFNEMLNEADNHRIFVEEQINKIKQQQILLNNFYENKLKDLNHIHEFVRNINHNYLEYEKTFKQFQLIKEQQNNYSFIQQIDQIIEPKDEMTMDSAESTTDSETFSLTSKWMQCLYNSTCPLSQINVFGFSNHHDIPGIPCNFLKIPNSLTYGRCYYHLLSYHRLKSKVAKLILKIISSDKDKKLDLTTLNTFSTWSSDDILSKSKTFIVNHCPLTQENIYGIQTHHNVVLCTPRPPVHLYHHLCGYHRFKSHYALRLLDALVNNEPFTKEIFQPNEEIINDSK